ILRHISLGADDDEPHSPFYGGRNSLLPRMFGNDGALYSGQGVRIVGNPLTGRYFVDNNFDGRPDTFSGASVDWWKQINHSPAATREDRTRLVGPHQLRNVPAPDVGHSYPDHSSPFLFYDSWVPDPSAPGTMRRVMLPSYFRPQLLRNLVDPSTGGRVPPSQWFTNAATAPYVMAPHVEHRAILRSNLVAKRPGGAVEIRRFVSTRYPEPATATQPAMTPFPFPVAKHGVWSGDRDPLNGNIDWYDYGVDLDGDGVNESFYMDFDLQMRRTPDGTRTFVPMAAVKMIPLDNLLNVNYHGNVSRVVQSNILMNINGRQVRSDGQVRAMPNYRLPIHGSQQGVHVSETNPAAGLLASPIQQAYQMTPPDFSRHSAYWSAAPTTRAQLANMEYWWLKTGWLNPTTGSGIPGLYGEIQLLRDRLATPPVGAQVFPGPGRTLPSVPPLPFPVSATHDDNGNRASGAAYSQTLWRTVMPPDSFSLFFPRFGHPLDYRGGGRNYTGVTRRLMRQVGRHVFPVYLDYLSNRPAWPIALPAAIGPASALLVNANPRYPRPWRPSQLINEAAETGRADSLFSASQTLALQLFDAQLTAAGLRGTSVLRLAPYNFLDSPNDRDPTRPQNPIGAETIRRLYTTESWDVNTFGKTFYTNTGDPRYRAWESTSGFPPRWPAGVPDPFRPEVRNLLRMRPNSSINAPTGSSVMKRLSVNRILDGATWRPLTPHPPNLPPAPITASGASPLIAPPLPTSPQLIAPPAAGYSPTLRLQRQEWLARYDRQRMCRDIYVLLYLFGGGRDRDGAGLPLNYQTTSNAGGQVYTAAQLKEMAQFAVNMVDQLDGDDVITRFEYDVDLSNGWNLDDDPFSNVSRLTGVLETDRAVVHGVEAQRLAFSEALPIFAKKTETAGAGIDHAATDYDDSKHHIFTYFELQNVSPFPVSFNRAAWQVVIKDGRPSTAPPPLATDPQIVERRLTFLPLAGSVSTAANGSDARSRYSVGTQDDTGYVDASGNIKPSYFLVNPQHGEPVNTLPGPIRIAPATTNSFFDLMVGGSISSYRINQRQAAGRAGDGNRIATSTLSPSGAQLLTVRNPDGITTTGQLAVKLQLRRRLNPNRQEPTPITATGSNVVNHSRESADNPWIVVDEIVVPLRLFHLANPAINTAALRAQLQQVRSRERIQPLDDGNADFPLTGTNAGVSTISPFAYRLNSIGTVNRATTSDLNLPVSSTGQRRFTLWQPHFDSDFASAAELMRVPLYGPSELTQKLGAGPNSNKTIALRNTAAARFMTPLTSLPGPGAARSFGNRWYRVLELLGVSSSGSSFGRRTAGRTERVPGRLNPNTMSHPASLAALLDAPDFLRLNPLNRPPFLNDTTPGLATPRDWWAQFLRSRDGVDPITGLTLPGVPGRSKPFRRLDYVAQGANSIEHTLLRSLPQDGNAFTGRRLFEIGNKQDHDFPDRTRNRIDVTTRYRLLPKVLNNTTTRGNLFLLAVQIDYFEAREVPTASGETVVRIGGKLPGSLSPGTLTYYILDRSRMVGLQPRDVAQVRTDFAGLRRFTWSFRQNLNFQRMIIFRRKIR
ncbi:MAG: hypothetical protein ACE5KM_04270, partial [Planctomycetaceae bacterium]